MKIKLYDLKGLESVTIAAYDIPDKMVLASPVKRTRASGKNNAFISGKPSEAIVRDLEVLSVSAHRLSCTYSFAMDASGYQALVDTLKASAEFSLNEKRQKKDNHVFYVNKRKFTISYFSKKAVAVVYASSDLFDTYLAKFFIKRWGQARTPEKNSGKSQEKGAKNQPKAVREQSIKALTVLPSEETLKKEREHRVQIDIQEIPFRVNRLAVSGNLKNGGVLKKIEKVAEKSRNSLSLRNENGQLCLVSNINAYLLEAVELFRGAAKGILIFELRFPVKTDTWKFLCANQWLEGAKNVEGKNGFRLESEEETLEFSRNANTGVCEMKGPEGLLMQQCIERLEDVLNNNFGSRRVDQASINDAIRKKIPYTVRLLGDQAEQFLSLISPSFVLLNDPEIELTDYSPMVFSVYRGVELYLKHLAGRSGIDLYNKPVGKLFKSYDPKEQGRSAKLTESERTGDMIETIFDNFNDYRNTLFHANLDNVVVIQSHQDAEDICVSALQSLEAASFQFYLEDMNVSL